MEELVENLKKEDIKDIYETYIKVKNIMDELNSHKKELPPKEEL